ncbi:MAG TPA: SIS domain-containing protein [Anaerolineae bacterium]|nr:SIS domain-containing protein [Anaerolineae bacterium]
MKPSAQYVDAITNIIRTIHDGEEANVLAAARVLADQIAQGNLIHVIGTGGHSMIGAEEMFFRAGGLVPINPIFEPGLTLAMGAFHSTAVERTPNLMPGVLKLYGLKPGGAIIIVNAYGINSATIDTALEAKRLGLTVIGVTGQETADTLAPNHPSRHPSGKNLYQIADIFINTHVPVGDAVLELAGVPQKVASISTFANAFVVEWLVIETVNLLVERGIEPPIWKSANSPGGDEYNKKYMEKYLGVIKHL